MENKIRFGVDWDKATTRVLNAILSDIMSYARLLPPTHNLVVVCKSPEMLEGMGPLDEKSKLYDIGGLKIGLERVRPDIVCDAWKLYYEIRRPDVPDTDAPVYFRRVGNNGVSRIKLTKNDPRYPSLFNPGDNRIVPPGKSPNINKIPPYYVNRGLPYTPYYI